MTDKNFSILMPLKDRVDYSYRVLSYLDHIKFPYKIILADGGEDEKISEVLQDPNNLSNLDYEYIRYPYDTTVSDFYNKMADAVLRVDTPTVAVLDNDDFILSEGITECLKILKDNPDFSSARGAVNNIIVSRQTYGTLTVGRNIYSTFPNSICAPTASERFKEQTVRFHCNWHNVTRSNHVKACWQMIREASPQNIRFTGQIAGYLNTLWGNSHRSDFRWLLHQQGERIKTEGGTLVDHFPPQDHWIKSDYWLEDFNKTSEVIGVAIAEYDNVSVEEGIKVFKETYPLKLPDLKELLDKRIKESNLLGYNQKRIDNLQSIVRENKIKEIQPIGDIVEPPFGSTEELELLSNFLSSAGNK